jgi:hypothetical protein
MNLVFLVRVLREYFGTFYKRNEIRNKQRLINIIYDNEYNILNKNDCSLIVFNTTDNQCALYNVLPIVEQELLPDDNTGVFLFQWII